MFSNYGFCYSCNSTTQFTAKNDGWRDAYLCNHCGSIPRERAVMYCVDTFFPKWRDLTIHETSPIGRGTSLRFAKECRKYLPSQYYPDQDLGKFYKGFQNENLEQLTFSDQTIDLHISQDVFEHVFNPAKAFKEIARTLKPGGAHIFTTPLVNKQNPSQTCAIKKDDGSVEQLIVPPEYHGNPISKDGSLVTVRWGYDITRFIFDASGLFTEVIYLDILDLGIRADLIEVLITRK